MITGKNLLGLIESAKGEEHFSSDQDGSTLFYAATSSEIEQACNMAQEAFELYRKINPQTRALFLEAIADGITALGEQLIDRCSLETSLPVARLQGERNRTVNQLRMFAAYIREGSWVDARIDTADRGRKPIPKPDIRHLNVAIGPVAVFGASNFPLAFSVAGGDTASALAAGCPVVVKGHPAHPGTSELVGRVIIQAAKTTGIPEGVFCLVQGHNQRVGETLVMNQKIKAVGFTGSYRGGKALFDIANNRPEPIPVFAEMGSTNPVFILPGALRDPVDLSQALANSIAMGVGQFCTNPGLILAQKSQDLDSFQQQLAGAMNSLEGGQMLTKNIKEAYLTGIDNYREMGQVDELTNKDDSASSEIKPSLFKVNSEFFASNKKLSEENFGPSSVLVEAENMADLLEIAGSLQGHLTATVLGNPTDLDKSKELIELLSQKVGRLIINGFPTGVEVCNSMVHGGPFPATTNVQSTSVGTNAINRFVRPLCYQDFPQNLLPPELQDDNPHQIWRLVDGDLTKQHIT